MTRRTRIRARPPDINQGPDSPGIDVEEGAGGRGALKTADIVSLDKERAERRMSRRVETQAGRYVTLQAFLKQEGVRIFRTVKTISVSFDSYVTADEFERFLNQTKRTK